MRQILSQRGRMRTVRHACRQGKRVMKEIRVASWSELLDLLYADSWNADLKRFRSNAAFRGLEAPDEELITGLVRLGGNSRELERHLLRNFRKYAAHDAVPV